MTLTHPFEPVWNGDSRILILGTFPSPKSRAFGFYYGHPQNMFWHTLAHVLDVPEPATDIAAKTAFLLSNQIAVWDVLSACEIDGASDSSIRNPIANQFKPMIENSSMQAIFTTGITATKLFNTLAAREAGMAAQYLPSTSPANRRQQNSAVYWELWNRITSYLRTW